MKDLSILQPTKPRILNRVRDEMETANIIDSNV